MLVHCIVSCMQASCAAVAVYGQCACRLAVLLLLCMDNVHACPSVYFAENLFSLFFLFLSGLHCFSI